MILNLPMILMRSLCITLLSIITLISSAQNTISGRILDIESNEALIGANIRLKSNSSIGTITDFDGYYTFEVPSLNDVIIISYTGYTDREEAISGRNEINLSLAAGEILDELVVVGYGTVKREDATGSIQSVSSKDFNKGAITSPQQLLAGKVAGVSITNSGDPGGGASIRIRGESSLTASNDPLIVVDGVPLDNTTTAGGRNNLNVINPNDIESITVLKDASATAIYGNRASAGVLLITTKKGTLGSKLRVGYNGNISIGNRTGRIDVLDANEFVSLIKDKFPKQLPFVDTLGNTNWQKEIYQQAIGTDHSLSLSGGVGAVPYRVSIGYTDMNGLLKTDNFNRLTGGINLSPKFIDNRLQVNLGLKAMSSTNNFADRGAIGNALSYAPTKPIYNSDSENEYSAWIGSNGLPISLAPKNPLALLYETDDESKVNRYIGNASIDYRFAFLPELRANLNLGYDKSSSDGFKYIDTTAAFSLTGVDNNYDEKKENSLLEFYLNYKKDISKNTIDVLGGYSWQRFGFEANSYNSNLTDKIIETKKTARELFLLSFFGRVNYDYNDKLYLTFTTRGDGTSRFGEGNKWGVFPAGALGYKLIDNTNKYLNYTKVRLGWGVTGQQDIGNNYYAALGAYEGSEPTAAYQFGDDFVNTLRANGYDGEIKWETTTTYNVGFDFSLIKDRISGSLDLYQRYTKDLLINGVPLAAGTNLTNVLDTNIGDMENKGVEVALNLTPIKKEKFQWDININMSYNKNEITRLRATQDTNYVGILTGGIAGGVGSNIQIHTVGFRPYSFYVYKQKYNTDGSIIPGEFEDLNNDGVINDSDKYRYESRQPIFGYGIASNLSYGDFSFSFAGRANVGNFIYNNVVTDIGWLKRVENQSEVATNIHQAAIDNNVELQSQVTFSDHFVTNASFFRLDHITFGYDLSKLVKKNVRVYATVQNPIVITKYTGLDPEEFSGIDNNLYPRPRTFVFGVSANF